MREHDQPARVTIIPAARYADAAKAIDWLCEAFGFERLMVVEGEDGSILHAQLVFGNGMFMLGSVRDDEYGRTQRTPAELGGLGSQGVYVIVADLEAHHARAVAAGAEIVMPLADQGHGWSYTCRDPEGHVWTFGDYDPWAPAETP